MSERTSHRDRTARIGPADLGIHLTARSNKEAFRWLVACQLFGARIRQEIAADTFRELDRAGMTRPENLAEADWQHLVDLLGAGGYRRYDESTARELIAVGRLAMDRYDGKITRIRGEAGSRKAAARLLQEFKGVGPTSARIFLREMAPLWDL
jgi:endonuclease III